VSLTLLQFLWFDAFPYLCIAAQREPVSQRTDDEKDCADGEYGSDYSGADSLASIDTISDDESNDGSESDVDKERHWRVRKILKYSRWQRDVDPSTSKGEKRAKDIERRIAKQEEKLRELGADAPRCLETVEEEEYDEPPVTRNPVSSPSS
jgi:hypothetical protein